MGLPQAILDAFRYRRLARVTNPENDAEGKQQKAVGDSVLKTMREHGIDPSSPDPASLMDPEVQRALRDAVLKHDEGGR
jgi:hypothetical protein